MGARWCTVCSPLFVTCLRGAAGGARVMEPPTTPSSASETLLALAADVQNVQSTMAEFERLESLLNSSAEDTDGNENKISGQAIELRQNIKKLMTSPDFLDSLNRLEVQGEPVWGLSVNEREMIMLARENVNEC